MERVLYDERFGRRVTFAEVTVGMERGPIQWQVTPEDIDRTCLTYGEFHEWYTVDSPFGGRIAPPFISYLPPRYGILDLYQIRGLLAGWDNEHLDVIRPGTPYEWRLRVTDKYVRRDREWVVFEATCTDAAGIPIIRSVRRHVLDYLPVTAPKIARLEGMERRESVSYRGYEVTQYLAPFITPRRPDEWERPVSVPVADSHCMVPPNVRLATPLPAVSQQLTWRLSRDYFDLMTGDEHPKWYRDRNTHTDDEAARREGLPAPNALGIQVAAVISRMMLAYLGEGWVRGGKFSLRFVKQTSIEDFITAKGTVVGKQLEGDRVRLMCDVWVENQRGERVIVGTAGGLCGGN